VNCSGWRATRARGKLCPGAGRDLEIVDDPASQPAVAGSGLPLNLSLTHELFQARHARFTMSNLLNFLPSMATTPAAFTAAWRWRGTTRTVRGSLSAEVWESINATRIELRKLRQQGWASWAATAFLSG
jgi:uncharacterized alpha-E superfamily protein